MRTINLTLNNKSIQDAIKQLEKYKDGLNNKVELFVSRLADIGIDTAKTLTTPLEDIGSVGGYVYFEKKIDSTETGAKAIVIMADTMPVVSAWLGIDSNGKKVVKTARVSPTLMYEFGSGLKAKTDSLESVNAYDGVGGIGTFPSNLNKPTGNRNHAQDGIWHWMDLDGSWHSSTGITPTQPMLNAFNRMFSDIHRVAKEVFK